jgi:hypothetical protein
MDQMFLLLDVCKGEDNSDDDLDDDFESDEENQGIKSPQQSTTDAPDNLPTDDNQPDPPNPPKKKIKNPYENLSQS